MLEIFFAGKFLNPARLSGEIILQMLHDALLQPVNRPPGKFAADEADMAAARG
jgi:hypothetical protein